MGEWLQFLAFIIFLLILGHIWGYYISIFVFTLGEVFTTIVLGPIFAEAVSEDFRGRIYGLSSFIAAVVTGFFQYYSGIVFDNEGSSRAWIFSIIMAGTAAIGGVIVWRLHLRQEGAI